MEQGINLAEPDDIETLNLATKYIHGYNATEYVRIGVLEENASGSDGTVSFVLVQFDMKMRCKTLQANLSLGEIDIVIGGLQEAKKRMLELAGKVNDDA